MGQIYDPVQDLGANIWQINEPILSRMLLCDIEKCSLQSPAGFMTFSYQTILIFHQKSKVFGNPKISSDLIGC
jgi:hypothetical protein